MEISGYIVWNIIVTLVLAPLVYGIRKNENEINFYVSVLTFGEFHKGIEKLPESGKKETLRDWVEHELKNRFQNRIIGIDLYISAIWGKIQSMAEKHGRPMPAIDSLIAATGIAHDLTVVTRNVSDMEQSGVRLFNPWLL